MSRHRDTSIFLQMALRGGQCQEEDRPGGKEPTSAGQQSAGLIGTLLGAGLDTKGGIGEPAAHGRESGDGASTIPTISPDHSPTEGCDGEVKVWVDTVNAVDLVKKWLNGSDVDDLLDGAHDREVCKRLPLV